MARSRFAFPAVSLLALRRDVRSFLGEHRRGGGCQAHSPGWTAFDREFSRACAPLEAAAVVGAFDTIANLTVEHARLADSSAAHRAFQVGQHTVARLSSEAAAAGSAVPFAGRAADDADYLWRSAIPKAQASETAGLIAVITHQGHGAVGFTREYALHRRTSRSSTTRRWSPTSISSASRAIMPYSMASCPAPASSR